MIHVKERAKCMIHVYHTHTLQWLKCIIHVYWCIDVYWSVLAFTGVQQWNLGDFSVKASNHSILRLKRAKKRGKLCSKWLKKGVYLANTLQYTSIHVNTRWYWTQSVWYTCMIHFNNYWRVCVCVSCILPCSIHFNTRVSSNVYNTLSQGNPRRSVAAIRLSVNHVRPASPVARMSKWNCCQHDVLHRQNSKMIETMTSFDVILW